MKIGILCFILFLSVRGFTLAQGSPSTQGSPSIQGSTPTPSPVGLPSSHRGETPTPPRTSQVHDGTAHVPRPVLIPVSPGDAKVLLKEFMRAQSTELRALSHRQKFEMKELKASQDAHLREWEKKERDARYKFFEAHTHGPERRTYIHDFIQRRKALRKHFVDEHESRVQEQKAYLTSLKKVQTESLKNFKKYLDHGHRPPDNLWPRLGE